MALINGSRGKFFCLTIIGQIEGHNVLPPENKTTKYEHLLPLLVNIQEDDSIDGVIIMLNTMGGDVEAGLAIAEMISGIKKPTVSLVIGGGHSIGIPLAVSSKYSFITPTATMTLHPVRLSGTVISSPQTFCMLEKMQDRINEFIVRNSKISNDRLKELMMNTKMIATDVGTILSGDEAVKEGIIDSVGTICDAINKLYEIKNADNQKPTE
ncbi:MAG: ATP-dependent Clp protease proteolytic subunit [Bacillota bacterium]|nr:ATP-dependent Clp protease proteolytic subunit [Bacillota bacterium]